MITSGDNRILIEGSINYTHHTVEEKKAGVSANLCHMCIYLHQTLAESSEGGDTIPCSAATPSQRIDSALLSLWGGVSRHAAPSLFAIQVLPGLPGGRLLTHRETCQKERCALETVGPRALPFGDFTFADRTFCPGGEQLRELLSG